jgi:hypothetical protein
MTLKIENFFSPRGLAAVRSQGLHKIAGAMVGVDEVTVKDAAQIIGTKAHLRRREFQKISAGIAALAAVTEG